MEHYLSIHSSVLFFCFVFINKLRSCVGACVYYLSACITCLCIHQGLLFFINKHRSCVRACVCVCVYQLPFGGRNIQELYIAVTRKEPFYPGFLSPDAISFNKKVINKKISPCGVLVETLYPQTSSAIAIWLTRNVQSSVKTSSLCHRSPLSTSPHSPKSKI